MLRVDALGLAVCDCNSFDAVPLLVLLPRPLLLWLHSLLPLTAAHYFWLGLPLLQLLPRCYYSQRLSIAAKLLPAITASAAAL